MAQDRPNVLVFFTDQQRYDSLGCNGNAVAATPNIDALAASGARLSNHIVANPVCMPSRASFFTGRFPNAHHVWINGIPLPAWEQTLPQQLQNLGYDTASFGKLHLSPTQSPPAPDHLESVQLWATGRMADWHGPYYGFDHVELTLGHGDEALRFGHYADDVRRRFGNLTPQCRAAQTAAAQSPIRDSYPSAMPVEAHHSTWVADQTIAYLRDQAREQRPWFAFCSFPDPHHPFTPPEPYASKFAGQVLPGPYRAEGEAETKPANYSRELARVIEGGAAGVGRLGPEHDAALRTVIAHTYGMVSLIDDSVGRVLDELTATGLDQNTVVVFTSDHGELLGDHSLLRKGPFPCRSLLRVPCIIRVPGLTPPGTVIAGPTSNTDLLPTLVSLAGGRLPDRVQGRPLISALRGDDPGPPAALSMGWSRDPRYHHQSLFTDRWRLSWFPNLDDGELYDLDNDPHELINRYHNPSYQKIRTELLLELHRHYTRTEEPTPPPVANH